MAAVIVALGIIVVAALAIRAIMHKAPDAPVDPNAASGPTSKVPEAK